MNWWEFLPQVPVHNLRYFYHAWPSELEGTVGYTSYFYQSKDREPEWPNPKLNVGNCQKSSIMDEISCTLLYQVAQIFKNVNFPYLLKHISMMFSRLGGLTQLLWVRPLWFWALQLLCSTPLFSSVICWSTGILLFCHPKLHLDSTGRGSTIQLVWLNSIAIVHVTFY